MAAVDYLQFRERLKEGIRKKKRQNNYANSISLSAAKLAYDDHYGSFFGPSVPTISQRVIEETKALLQNPSFYSAPTSKPEKKIGVKSPKPKAQILKKSRDYSFLSADDNVAPAKSDSAGKQAQTNSENGKDKLADVKCTPSKGLEKQSVKSELKKELVRMNEKVNGLKPIKSKVHGLKQFQTAAQIQKYARDYSFLTSDSAEPQKSDSSGKSDMASCKQKKSSNGIDSGPVKSSGPKRPPLPSSFFSRKSVDTNKQIGGKSISGLVQSLGPRGGKSLVPVKPVLSTKPKQVPDRLGRTNLKEAQIKKRPRECLDDGDDVDPDEISRMIRGMFGYNPRKYVRDDRDDINMEASFHDIEKEERRSAKLAKKEDQEELQKIMEEEKREKKMKKKLKT